MALYKYVYDYDSDYLHDFYQLLYTSTVIGTLAVDGWAVTFGTARRGLGGLGPRPVPSSLYQM